MKKYKRGETLFYIHLQKPCKVLLNTLLPAGLNLGSAFLIVQVEKMAHPVCIPVIDQDTYLAPLPNTDKTGIENPNLPLRSLILFLLSFSYFGAIAQASAQKQPPLVFSPRIKAELNTAAAQEKPAYKILNGVLPTAFGVAAGASANTEAGKAARDAAFYGAAMSITFGRPKPFYHYLINVGLTGVGFLAGRGIREMAE